MEEKLKTLDLVLKAKWYDLIDKGIKKEEYREIKDYWCKRLKGFARICPYSLPSDTSERICQFKGAHCLSGNEIKYGKIRFRRGYSNTYMTFNIDKLRIGIGNTEWGAPEDKNVFIFELGQRIVKVDEN